MMDHRKDHVFLSFEPKEVEVSLRFKHFLCRGDFHFPSKKDELLNDECGDGSPASTNFCAALFTPLLVWLARHVATGAISFSILTTILANA